MTDNSLPSTSKPRLDDLLTTMGITREQLGEMTADDLFAAATQWQDAAMHTDAEVEQFPVLDDHFLETLQDHPARPGMLN
ncbi:MAG: hypothetical protein JO296_14245 [Pseudonocardiales bacterium]|jgi:hypothetical protein|nr:hypothetical protein [Pseudonocardiales bacterium]MBV9651280.1 hypothetical protein [Pseudonocardiales bacterium]